MSSAAGKRRMARVAALGCVICARIGYGHTPGEVHHIRTEQGASNRASDGNTICLCPEHHRGASGFHGLGRKAFERTYKVTEIDLLGETNLLLEDAR